MADGPDRVGRYEIVSRVGQGAMGVVYKARDPLIGRTVAIKMVAASAFLPEDRREEFKRRFLREAQAAGNLHHPNIVTIYDLGEEGGTPFMAQEFVEGESLAQRVKARGALPLEEALGIARQVAEGLAFAHERGVIHRDIKPDNILLDKAGRAVITDFGIARLSESELTRTGEVLGTPTFMSPEQVQGLDLDGRSDLFSLGAVLFLMVTGQKPFKGETISSVCYQVVHAPPQPAVGQLALPPAVVELLLRLLAKSPSDRFASAAELAGALGEALDRTVALGVTEPGARTAPTRPAPTVTAPAPTPEPGPAPRRRGAGVAVAIGGGILAVLALGILAAWGLHRVQVLKREKAKAAPAQAQHPPAVPPGAVQEAPKPALAVPGAQRSAAEARPVPPPAKNPGVAPPPRAQPARLGLVAEGPVLMGQLVLSVDGKERLRRPFTGGQSAGGRRGFLVLDRLEVAPGDHDLHVVVGGMRPEPFVAEASKSFTFRAGEELILNVMALRAPSRLRIAAVPRQDLPSALAGYFGPNPQDLPAQDSPLAVLGEAARGSDEGGAAAGGPTGRLELVVEGSLRAGVFSVLEGGEQRARESFEATSRRGGKPGFRLDVNVGLPAGAHDLVFALEASAPGDFRARAEWHLDLAAGQRVKLRVTPRRPDGLEIVEVP